MKSFRVFLAITTPALAILFTLAASTATAGTTGNGWAQRQDTNGGPQAPAPPPVDTRILIMSVDVAAGTVEFESMRDKTTQTYKIDAMTRIVVSNNQGTLDQIKAGMEVTKYRVREGQTLAGIRVDQAQ